MPDTEAPSPARSPTDPHASNPVDVGHWLPRAVLAGMLALILVLLLGTGGYFIYRHEHAFETKAVELEARARSEQESLLAGEVNRLTAALQTQRTGFTESMQMRLKARVDHAINIAASIHASLAGAQPHAALERVVAQALRSIRDTNGLGKLFILDDQNRALLFPLMTQFESADRLNLTDDSGQRFIDSFRQAARSTVGDYVNFRWHPPGEVESMADATAFVRLFEPFGWTIGSSEFLHLAHAALKRSLVASLFAAPADDTRFSLLINADGRVLSPLPAAYQDASGAPVWWIRQIANKGLIGGGAVQFSMQLPGQAQPSRHLAYAAPVDLWGWTVAAVTRLDEIDQFIVSEREQMRISTREDFGVTLFTMLAAYAVAFALSVLFYRWMDERFRRYHRDIETRNRALQDNARALHLSAKVFEASNEAIAILDHRFRIISVNPALERVSGFKHASIVGRHCGELLTGETDDGGRWHDTEAHLDEVPQWAGEMELRRADGSAYPGWVSVGAIAGENDRHSHYVVSIADVSPQKRNEQRLRHMAEYDALTGLPNR
ncbi:MAG: cache domain-containing protein, partial [Rhodocyclaceae bacterium]|nr:cache domain-containing protein [Rhodocyclaceae bacterium]